MNRECPCLKQSDSEWYGRFRVGHVTRGIVVLFVPSREGKITSQMRLRPGIALFQGHCLASETASMGRCRNLQQFGKMETGDDPIN